MADMAFEPATRTRPACRAIAERYRREAVPLQARTYTAPSTTTDQIHVGVPGPRRPRGTGNVEVAGGRDAFELISGPISDRRLLSLPWRPRQRRLIQCRYALAGHPD